MSRTVCKSCKADVVWAKTEADKWMPVDAAPTNVGNLVLIERGTEPPLAVYQSHAEADQRRADGADLWISHFATCPDSARFR